MLLYKYVCVGGRKKPPNDMLLYTVKLKGWYSFRVRELKNFKVESLIFYRWLHAPSDVE